MTGNAPPALALDESALHPGNGNLLAFSGGPDSVCLLHLLLARGLGSRLRIVHVDHAMDTGSGERARRAQALAKRLGARCTVERLEPETRNGDGGPESAARTARYARLKKLMRAGDHLLTAHHADDQVETVVMRLLRGAGPTGLAGMASLRPLPPGWLARPLLNCRRAEILDYLRAHAIKPVSDPGNSDLSLDRNYLRHRVLPTIASRWPGYREPVLRSAAWQRSAAAAVDGRARKDWQSIWTRSNSGEARLSLPDWLALEPQRAFAVVRHWCQIYDLPEPPPQPLRDFRRQCLDARSDRQPLLDWPVAQLRAHRDALWLDKKPLTPAGWQLTWSPERPAPLPAGGTLVLSGTVPRNFVGEYILGPAPAGARLRLETDRPSRSVNELMREAGIPPWRRPALPALMLSERLLAVGPDWLDARFAQSLRSTGARLEWRGRPRGLLPSASSHADR